VILRRMINSLRSQNWVGLSLELLVLVAGVFLGLQVDDWNEDRKDRLREVRYLERIDVDLAKDIASIEYAIALMDDRVRRGHLLLESIDNPAVIESDPTDFVLSIEQSGYTFTPDVANYTFEEIKFAGDFAIIESEALRDALSNYYVLLFRAEQWNYLREYTQNRYKDSQLGILSADQTIAMAISGNLGISFSQEEARGVYERMLQKPDFIEFVPYAIMDRQQSKDLFTNYLVTATALRGLLAAQLNILQGFAESGETS
jgi:Family of unknown function (DUF6090)